jgi:hypothetical protein
MAQQRDGMNFNYLSFELIIMISHTYKNLASFKCLHLPHKLAQISIVLLELLEPET